MRFSCLDATEYLSWPRCLEVPHGVNRETDFITYGPFILLCTPEIGAVAKADAVRNTDHPTDDKSFPPDAMGPSSMDVHRGLRRCNRFRKATPFCGLLV